METRIHLVSATLLACLACGPFEPAQRPLGEDTGLETAASAGDFSASTGPRDPSTSATTEEPAGSHGVWDSGLSAGTFEPPTASHAEPPMEAPVEPPADPTPVANGPDSDGDGLSDLQETRIGTDPGKADTDGGGALDGVEVNRGSNPWFPGDD